MAVTVGLRKKPRRTESGLSVCFTLFPKSSGFIRVGAVLARTFMSQRTWVRSHMNRFRLWASMTALITGAAAAQAPPQVVACQACHGRVGISDSSSIPNLAGQKADYLAAQLRAFKSGERKNDLMAAIASQLSEADMVSLAKHWSAQPPALAAAPGAQTVAIASRMGLPTGFPAGFVVYDTVVDTEQKIITKRHANTAAVAALRQGRPLPDGSAVVVVNHALESDAQGQPKAGAARGFSAMESRAGWGAAVPELLRNGNWDYALFNAQGVRNDKLNQAQCLACHKPVAADDYVFTMKALREFALR
jgi:cytochrome c553